MIFCSAKCVQIDIDSIYSVGKINSSCGIGIYNQYFLRNSRKPNKHIHCSECNYTKNKSQELLADDYANMCNESFLDYESTYNVSHIIDHEIVNMYKLLPEDLNELEPIYYKKILDYCLLNNQINRNNVYSKDEIKILLELMDLSNIHNLLRQICSGASNRSLFCFEDLDKHIFDHENTIEISHKLLLILKQIIYSKHYRKYNFNSKSYCMKALGILDNSMQNLVRIESNNIRFVDFLIENSKLMCNYYNINHVSDIICFISDKKNIAILFDIVEYMCKRINNKHKEIISSNHTLVTKCTDEYNRDIHNVNSYIFMSCIANLI